MSVRSNIAVGLACLGAGLAGGKAFAELSTMHVGEHNDQAALCAENWPDVVKTGGNIAVASCQPLADRYGELDKQATKEKFVDAHNKTSTEVAREETVAIGLGGALGLGSALTIMWALGPTSDRRKNLAIEKRKALYYELG